MGERLLCKQEVIGSIPFSSTRRLALPAVLVVLSRRSEPGQSPTGAVRCCLTLWIGCVPARAGSLAVGVDEALPRVVAWVGREEVLSVLLSFSWDGRLAPASEIGRDQASKGIWWMPWH